MANCALSALVVLLFHHFYWPESELEGSVGRGMPQHSHSRAAPAQQGRSTEEGEKWPFLRRAM